MNLQLVQTAFLAFLIGMIIAPIFISLVKRLALGQQIREEGPRKHFKSRHSHHGRYDFSFGIFTGCLVFST